MNILGTMEIGHSALRAQTTRLNTISSNLANTETTQTPEGGPYQKKSVVFESTENGFQGHLDKSMGGAGGGVRVREIISDQGGGKMVYEPSHPDADEEGYVEKPDISLVEQMTDMMSAKGSYKANVETIKSAQDMAKSALEIGR